MDIVTIACTRDKHAVVLQAESIKLYVTTKITHWVILQDTETSHDEWHSLLQPFYQDHELKIIDNWVDCNLNGWNQQQILKFQASKFINNDSYLILDSKNLFIKKTDLSEFSLEGHRHYIDTVMLQANFNAWYKYIQDNLNFNLPKISWVPQTPFTVKTDTVNRLIASIDLEKFYIDFFKIYPHDHPSEFLLYRFFSDPPKNIIDYQHIIWNRTFLRQLNKIDPKTVCLGIHRQSLMGTTSRDKDVINLYKFLTDLKFSNYLINNLVTSLQNIH